MAVLEDWDRRSVEARLTGVSGLDYFRRLPEVIGDHLENRGLLELGAGHTFAQSDLGPALERLVLKGDLIWPEAGDGKARPGWLSPKTDTWPDEAAKWNVSVGLVQTVVPVLIPGTP